METGKAVLTVLFEDPFWIGVYEREWDGRYEVCKITFGAEPKDYEVYDFLLKNWKHLPFSLPVKAAPMAEHAVNPKRLQREIRRATRPAGVGTKARQALKLQQEQRKAERTERGREHRDAEKDRQYALRQEKRRQKHRGH
ncbi:MAG: YjdF family protein [Oscillospiraceae bacterium]|nr:YjdF family protein [Oscillospiraceae bacterium]